MNATRYTPTPEQQEAWDALLAWLDAGGTEAASPLGPLSFDMRDSVSGFDIETGERPVCGSTACMGGFITAWALLRHNVPSDGTAFCGGEWLGMPADDVERLFYRWIGGEARDPAQAAARVRHYLATGETPIHIELED